MKAAVFKHNAIFKKKYFEASKNLILLQPAADWRNNRMAKKQLITLEYPVRCSPIILYEFLSTPAGLQEWFADKVDERDHVFIFTWNGSAEKAQVVEKEQDKFIRYHWITAPKEEYFEFRIEKTEISNQTILVIKDFAEKAEIKDQTQLWDYQVKELLHRIGS
ncbi:MAG TPA: START-like domain-containing protein [Chitinophagaceae bacterium]|nr:START-like domain-containing protein [Chitinophagaceae bacterium]